MAETDRDEAAEQRTDLAEDRTILANERTFAGWLRTSFGAVAIGLGFNALFQTLEPAWVPKAIATVFLVLAIFLVIAAERRACAVMDRLQPHEVKSFRQINLRLVAWATATATAALIAAVWVLAAA